MPPKLSRIFPPLTCGGGGAAARRKMGDGPLYFTLPPELPFTVRRTCEDLTSLKVPEAVPSRLLPEMRGAKWRGQKAGVELWLLAHALPRGPRGVDNGRMRERGAPEWSTTASFPSSRFFVA